MTRRLLALSLTFGLITGLVGSLAVEGAAPVGATLAAAKADRCTASTKDGAAKQIRAAYATLLNGGSKASPKQRAAIIVGTDTDPALRSFLLDTYAQYAPLLKNLKVKVRKVTCAGPTNAVVTFNLLAGPLPFLRDQVGTAVLEGGRWKIDKSVVCKLVSSVAPDLTTTGPCTT